MPISIVENIDCMEGMKSFPDKYFELALVDPEYGINMGNRQSVTYKNNGIGGKGFHSQRKYVQKNWDTKPPEQSYFDELVRVSVNQIIWGGNYFADKLPISRGWIFWDKKITNSHIENYGDGELAWTSFDRVIKRYTYDWIGFGYLNNPQKQKRIHPTEKPWQLYKYLLQDYAKQGDKILDTHLGSQSSRIAAYDMGFDFWGYELDKDYFDAAEKRFQEFKSQGKLF
jgi:site-specific DNA-methyltransferase (adenine-specific)